MSLRRAEIPHTVIGVEPVSFDNWRATLRAPNGDGTVCGGRLGLARFYSRTFAGPSALALAGIYRRRHRERRAPARQIIKFVTERFEGVLPIDLTISGPNGGPVATITASMSSQEAAAAYPATITACDNMIDVTPHPPENGHEANGHGQTNADKTNGGSES
jgi:hypothetical protein